MNFLQITETIGPTIDNAFKTNADSVYGVLVGVLVFLLIAGGLVVFIALKWVLGQAKTVLTTMYADFKEDRNRENDEKKAHAERLETELGKIGGGLADLHDIVSNHEIRIVRLEERNSK